MDCPARVRRTAALALAALLLGGSLPVEGQSELVLLKKDTTGQSQYHRAACPVVRDGKDVLATTRAEAEARGAKAHPACENLAAAPADGQPGSPAATPPEDKGPAPDTPVFVDAGKHYHRQGCAKLDKQPRKVLLKDAGPRWPCTVCRPPVRKRIEGPPLVPRWRG